MKQGREVNGGRESRLLRALVRLYPRAFRERFGDDVLRTLGAAHRAASASGVPGRVAFWLRNVPDLMVGAVRERIGISPRRAKRRNRKMTMDSLLQNVRYTLRRLARSPLLTAATVATLAIAIGANSAVFSVVNGVLIEPLPFDEPDRLVGLWYTAPGADFIESVPQSPAAHFTYLEESRSFESIGVWDPVSASVTGLEEPEEVQAMRLTHTTLPILRVQSEFGRIFNEQDDSPGTPLTVVLGHGYWQRRFGGARDVIGQTLNVDGRAREIIGVLPASFQFLDYDFSLYLPFRFNPENLSLGNWSYPALARLRPGVTIEQANADVDRMIPLAVERFPGGMTQANLDEIGLAADVRPLKDDVLGDVGSVLWVLLGTVGIVLMIACANVSNLFLVRANERETEVAVRTAMGASRGALVREFLVESMTLGLLGGVGGLMLAYGGVNLLHLLAPEGLPRLDQIAIRPVVLLFTLGLALLTGLLFGLVPVLRRGHDPAGALKEGGGRSGGVSKGRSRVRDALVVAQVALALVLLVGAGLMIRSLLALGEVRPGFERPEEVLTVGVNVPSAEVREPELVALSYEQMLRNLEAIPGVTSVGASSSVTMDGQIYNNDLFFDGFRVPEEQIPPQVRHKWVLPGYFVTMQNIPLAGRSITWADIHARAPVAVITENVAIEYWGSAASAIGRRVRETSNDDRPWREIVGVVGDIRDDGLSEGPVRTVYWPAINEQFRGPETMVSRTMTFVIRTPRLHTAGFMDEVSAAIWAVNPNVPPANIQTLRKILDRSMARTSFAVVMLMIASAAALLLGVVGIYGVTSYAVAQRRHELGIRMALGAQRGDISRLVLRHALALATLGAAGGVAMAVGLTWLMTALLYGVSAVDPLTFAIMILFLGGTTVFASWIPARRAARANPMVALRTE